MGLPLEPWHTFPLLALHGKMPQKKRRAVIEAFRNAPAGVLVCTDVAARGLDVPDVDCVVQLDAPKEVDTYVHRVGRAARAGRRGTACILLSSQERDFEELLRLKGMPVAEAAHMDPGQLMPGVLPSRGPEATQDAASAAALAWRRMASSDRAILEAGSNAVLAHLRGYGEHIQKIALPFAKLDIAGISRSWGLLKSPNVKEARGMPPKQKEWWADPDEIDLPPLASASGKALHAGAGGNAKGTASRNKGKASGRAGRGSDRSKAKPLYPWPVPDTSVVGFLDPDREAARQARLLREREKAAEVAARLGIATESAGDAMAQLPKMAGKGEKAMAKAAKQLALRAKAEHEREAQAEGSRRGRKRKGQQQRLFEEWDELADESRLLRKLKRGEITDEQYDHLTSKASLGSDGLAELDASGTSSILEQQPPLKKRREDGPPAASQEASVSAGTPSGSVRSTHHQGSSRASLLAAVKATVLGPAKSAKQDLNGGKGSEDSAALGQGLVRRLHEEHRRQKRHASKSTKKVRANRQDKRKSQASGGGGKARKRR